MDMGGLFCADQVFFFLLSFLPIHYTTPLSALYIHLTHFCSDKFDRCCNSRPALCVHDVCSYTYVNSSYM